MILLAILCRFVLVVDMYYIQKSCQEDRGIYTNCQRFLLFDKERLTPELEQTLKNFCCLLSLGKRHGGNYEQVVSDIENRDTHCKFLHWL